MAIPLLLLLAVAAYADDPAQPAALFAANCASCHEHPETKAPPIETLRQLPFGRILQTLTFGIMQPQAAGLSPAQRAAIAQWLAAEEDGRRAQWLSAHACAVPTPVDPDGAADWGFGAHNQRHAVRARIAAADVPRLELAWSLALPAVTAMRSQPLVSGNTLFVGGQDGRLLALDRHTGCVRWSYTTGIPIRTALSLHRTADGIDTLFFADEFTTVYALDATRGALRWKTEARNHPFSIVSGAMAFHAGRLYVPLSSFEVAVAGLPAHECCRAHGGVLALDAATGRTVWSYATTPDAKPTTRNRDGVQMWGPSGAVVWNRPTIDARRGLLYIGTGQNASSPATTTSDAIVALDLASGAQRWVFQALANDAWNSACLLKGANCPAENGPDFDFGAPPILLERAQGDLLLAGQKSGWVYALDPDRNGAVVWKTQLSQGTSNGGIHHGMASDGERLIVTIADPERATPGYTAKPAVVALAVDDGHVLWRLPVSRDCGFDPADAPAVGLAEMRKGTAARTPWPACGYYYGMSAPPTLANGLVYAGALDGRLRILEASSGQVLRTLETNRVFAATNGVEGHGGALDVAGPVVDGEQLFLVSGYGMFGQLPGNLVLAYRARRD